MRALDPGKCEHCAKLFGYYLIHNGFNESCYAYCDTCGVLQLLNGYSLTHPNKLSELLAKRPGRQAIYPDMEEQLRACACGGHFRRDASPRCPHCKEPLSAELAAKYIEANAPGAKGGRWRWQRNWVGMYCIVVENRLIKDAYRD
jgi:hypothetical protein